MNRMKNILIDKFDAIRRQNPNATVVNLIAGMLIIVFLAIFSVWYFGNGANLFNQEMDGQNVTEGQRSMITVEQGEGLWQIAERVCGDGELYNEIAEENGLNMWAGLETGQQLTVSCDY